MTIPKKDREKKSQGQIVPVFEILRDALNATTKKPAELAVEMEYKSANVLSMLKSGAMSLPLNKVVLVGRALGIDTTYLLTAVDRENQTNLVEIIQDALARPVISDNEMKLVMLMREASHGLDINLDNEVHESDRTAIVHALATAADRQWEIHKGRMRAIEKPRANKDAPDEKSSND